MAVDVMEDLAHAVKIAIAAVKHVRCVDRLHTLMNNEDTVESLGEVVVANTRARESFEKLRRLVYEEYDN